MAAGYRNEPTYRTVHLRLTRREAGALLLAVKTLKQWPNMLPWRDGNRTRSFAHAVDHLEEEIGKVAW